MHAHTVLLFGPLRDHFEAASITVRLAAGTPLSRLLEHLGVDSEFTRVAVNGVIVPIDTPLNEPSEIALLPPVSGG